MAQKQIFSEFLEYLAENYRGENDCPQLPSLSELSKQLGVSVSTLREQMEAARALGFVEARPRTGTRRLPYSFLPAVRQSLSYAMAIDPETFQCIGHSPQPPHVRRTPGRIRPSFARRPA